MQTTSPGRRGQSARGGGFALLSPAFLDELRSRTSLSALIGRSVKLTKAGNEYKACCPFHNEKSPSFYVNDDKQFYHCFGCSAHGDAIRFLTEAKGLAFMDAVKELADAAGLQLPAPDPVSREKAARAASLTDVVEAAATWFSTELAAAGGAEARAYLDRRGIGETTRRRFGIGFAPDSRNRIAGALPEFSRDMLVETGLLIQPEDRDQPYDRFRGRVMIPIRDQRGRAIAFGGRILDQGEPKYLNSPETPLFDKGRTLYNLHNAAPASRKSGRVIVVEGYMDVIALDQAGIAEAVAPLGTALTEGQLEKLWALVDTPTLCFDGDAAGRKAALRAAHRAMPLLRPGKSLAFAVLPAGEDPDDIIRRGGAAAFEAVIADALPLVAMLFRNEASVGDTTRPEIRAGLRQRLDDLAQSCTDRLVAEEYRRSFNDLFFEQFGWKKSDRQKILDAIVRTGVHGKDDLTELMLRSLLFGLSSRPAIVARRMEDIGAIPVAHPELRRWREALIGAVMASPDLEGGCIDAILAASELPELIRQDLRHDLRFPHQRIGIDEETASRSLDALLDMLCEEWQLDDELAVLDKAAIEDAGGDNYLAIETARQQLRERRLVLHDRSVEMD